MNEINKNCKESLETNTEGYPKQKKIKNENT